MRTEKDFSESERLCVEHFRSDSVVKVEGIWELGKKLVEEITPKEWEPSENGCWIITLDGKSVELPHIPETYRLGCVTKTKQESKLIVSMRVSRERLNARIREENLLTSWSADWDNPHQNKYCIAFDHRNSQYTIVNNSMYEVVGIEYCDFDSCEKIIRELNDGIVILDVL